MANSGHYFAYGSNLNVDDLAQREVHLAGLSAISPAWLPDHELVFGYRSMTPRGSVLDIRHATAKRYLGVLAQITGRWVAVP